MFTDYHNVVLSTGYVFITFWSYLSFLIKKMSILNKENEKSDPEYLLQM